MTMEAQAQVAAQPFDLPRAKFESLVCELRSPKTAALTHSEVERMLGREGIELMRQMFQAFLTSLGDGQADGPVQGAEGAERTHLRLEGRNMMTSFGPVRIERMGYGSRETKPLRPLDAELNLPRGLYSLPVQQRVAEEAAKVSFDETVAAISRTSGAQVPKRQAEELVIRAAQDFDGYYAQVERSAALASEQSGSVLVITTDGKGVVMRTEDLRAKTRRKAERRERKLTNRLCKGEKPNAKRMAQVAAVYTVGPFVRSPDQILGELAAVRDAGTRRPRPEHKRTWASLKRTPYEVIEEAYLEAERRDPGRQKNWVGLVDGNPDQLEMVRAAAKRHGVVVTTIVDFIHALEYVWRAGRALVGEASPELEGWVQERALRLLCNEGSQVAAGIRRAATLNGLTGWRRKAADRCANYLLTNKASMKYADYLRQGLPIATGVIEGACRHLVKDRMDLTGARWRLDRAEAVLQLRALRASGDFDAYWAFHEQQELLRNHLRHYIGQQVPPTRRPRNAPKLRLVSPA
jgi:hypothetical protein